MKKFDKQVCIVLGVIALVLLLVHNSALLTERACQNYQERHSGTTEMIDGFCQHTDKYGNVTILPL